MGFRVELAVISIPLNCSLFQIQIAVVHSVCYVDSSLNRNLKGIVSSALNGAQLFCLHFFLKYPFSHISPVKSNGL